MSHRITATRIHIFISSPGDAVLDPFRLMDTMASESVLDEGFAWLCTRRKNDASDDDVWDLRWRWVQVKPQLQASLQLGSYQLGATSCFMDDWVILARTR